MPCIYKDCKNANVLGSFYCGDHTQCVHSSMTLPPFIPFESIPSALGKQPDSQQEMVFAEACHKAEHRISALLADLDLKKADSQAAKAVKTVFGAKNLNDVKEVYEGMKDVLVDWRKTPKHKVTIEALHGFLGWSGGTTAQVVTPGLLFGSWWPWKAPAKITFPSLPDNVTWKLVDTLVHECAHGVKKEIEDNGGYQITSPTTFYRCNFEERLKNADHYAACLKLFEGKKTFEAWTAEETDHGQKQKSEAEVEFEVGELLADIRKLVGHAKIQCDRLIIECRRKAELNEPLGDTADVVTKLGEKYTQDTKDTKRAVVRAVDVALQLRNFEMKLRWGTNIGDGKFVKDPNITTSAVVVFPVNDRKIHVLVGLGANPTKRELRVILLDELLKKCLQTNELARKLLREHVVALYKKYNNDGDPIGIDS
jgi:hypothetical protein